MQLKLGACIMCVLLQTKADCCLALLSQKLGEILFVQYVCVIIFLWY